MQAVEELNGMDMGGREYVGRAETKAEGQEELRNKFDLLKLERVGRSIFTEKLLYNLYGVKLYGKNLAHCVDDELLRHEFSHFGNITSPKVDRFIGFLLVFSIKPKIHSMPVFLCIKNKLNC